MNAALIDAFRHNSWATKHLLAFCHDLTQEQLASSATGTYGDILATFNHIVMSEAAYLRRLSGSAPDWVERHRGWPGPEREELGGIDQLTTWVDELAQRWERFLAEPFDPERLHQVNDGAETVYAGVILAQVLHHASAHREQICAILTGMGLQPPDVQPWEYAWRTDRLWRNVPGTDPHKPVP